jgi:hypothetical protein
VSDRRDPRRRFPLECLPLRKLGRPTHTALLELRIDPKKQLKEAGYPFDHIGTELVSLHGKFEAIPLLYSGVVFLQKTALGTDRIAAIAASGGILIWIASFLVTRKRST